MRLQHWILPKNITGECALLTAGSGGSFNTRALCSTLENPPTEERVKNLLPSPRQGWVLFFTPMGSAWIVQAQPTNARPLLVS